MFTRGYLHLGLAPREFSDSRLLIVSHISAAIWPLHDLQKAVSAGLEKRHRKLKAGWWFQPSAKYESQSGSLFPIYGKIKNVPNHQPGKHLPKCPL